MAAFKAVRRFTDEGQNALSSVRVARAAGGVAQECLFELVAVVILRNHAPIVAPSCRNASPACGIRNGFQMVDAPLLYEHLPDGRAP